MKLIVIFLLGLVIGVFGLNSYNDINNSLTKLKKVSAPTSKTILERRSKEYERKFKFAQEMNIKYKNKLNEIQNEKINKTNDKVKFATDILTKEFLEPEYWNILKKEESNLALYEKIIKNLADLKKLTKDSVKNYQKIRSLENSVKRLESEISFEIKKQKELERYIDNLDK